MLASTYCVMETKQKRRHLKKGQVWRYPIYTSGLMDNELRGHVYFVLTEKKSQGMWRMKLIKVEPPDLTVSWKILGYRDHWTKSTEILRWFEQVDPEPFKTAIVLYG